MKKIDLQQTIFLGFMISIIIKILDIFTKMITYMYNEKFGEWFGYSVEFIFLLIPIGLILVVISIKPEILNIKLEKKLQKEIMNWGLGLAIFASFYILILSYLL